MTFEDIKDTIKSQALGMGACDKGIADYDNDDKDELIERYKKNIEFCIEHNFPSVDFIIKNFSMTLLSQHCVYVNEKNIVINKQGGTMVFLGECQGNVNLDRFSAPRMYVKDKCNLHINVKNFSKLFIDLYDEADVSISCDATSKAYVYAHNGLDKVECKGSVYYRDKSKK